MTTPANTTPAANSVPISDGSGKINDSWLSANIARLSTTQTWTVAQTIDLGSGSLPAAIGTPLLRLAQADGSSVSITGEAWGNPGILIEGRRAGTSRASPSATADGGNIILVRAYGHDGTGYVSGDKASIGVLADGAWSGSNTGTLITFSATTTGGTTKSEVMRLRKGAALIGATDVVGSERVRITGGSAPATPGSTDVLIGSGEVAIGATAASTSTTTGALRVAGGVGVAARMSCDNLRCEASGDTSSVCRFGASSAGEMYIQLDKSNTNSRMTFTASLSGTGGRDILFDGRTILIGGTSVGSPTSSQVSIGSGAIAVGSTTASTSTATGALTVAGGVGVGGQLTAQRVAVTAATISTTGAIAALASSDGYTRLTGAAPDIQGIAAPGGGAQRLTLYCQNATTLRHQNGTASTANRIVSDTGADISVAAGKTVELIYDPTDARWRPVRF